MDNRESNTQPLQFDEFDRMIGQLDGLPDVVKSAQSTARVVPTLGVGGVKTFIVQTYRHRENGDTIFVEYMDGQRSLRLIIPPPVANIISRQRDALTFKSRSKTAKQIAADRAARGELPTFTPEMRAKAAETRRRNARTRKAKRAKPIGRGEQKR